MAGRSTRIGDRRGLIAIAAAAALQALLGMQPATASVEAAGASAPELIQPHLVDIGGRRLNLVCVGEGSPTVVFDLPIFGHLLQWRKVIGPVSRISRACFFDRAGYDYSDPSPRPMTLANEADDLHRLLKAARIEGPVVLVGHSMGGLYASMYADRYPDEVAGLVLIDPSYAGAGLPAVTPEQKAAAQKDEDDSEAEMKRCADLARAGRLSAANSHGCFHLPPGWSPDEIAFLAWSFTRPYKYEAWASEFRSSFSLESGLDENSQEETRAAHSWGDKPVIVMTSGKNFEGADRRAERIAEWKAGHDRLAARSTQGVSLTVPDSGHHIQLDQPDAVVSAIETVVRKVRQGRPAG